ncbi:hypothetical protein ABEV34_14035 [Methylorubrum rhodesianum]|uniref:hypothetical protein n=1 Tax=Methylorubrum TaxID=2282523 RepID=UPI00160823DB|nr:MULTISPECIES: hypothetical protein [Methylorubrum]MBB5764196.1 hypothetical protein [Methylorubrum rhodesianum]MBI1690109.1 hypothetical protein [Methylorubrum sp. DB1722]
MLLPELASDPFPPEAAEWRKAFGILRSTSPQCRYVSAAAWANVHDACSDFIARFGAEAVRLGWTATGLFGVHPKHGTLRVDWCGGMITGGHKAIGIEPNRILFGNVSGYRNVPGAPVGVLICASRLRRRWLEPGGSGVRHG